MVENFNENDKFEEYRDELLHKESPAEAEPKAMETKSFLTNDEANAKVDVDNLDELIYAAASFGYAKKARDIVGIDLRDISSVADYFLIMSGSNKPQIKAISDNIEEKLIEQGLRPLRIEGYREAEWILLDYGTLVVHVFDEEKREYYNLERLWGDAPAYKFAPAD